MQSIKGGGSSNRPGNKRKGGKQRVLTLAEPSRPVYDLKDDPFSEYVQLVREKTKAGLQNITGRMYEVLNEYEDTTAEDSAFMMDYMVDLSEQIRDIENSAIRNNIQLLMKDYKDLCTERDSLLYSLQEWFEEEHIDEINLLDVDLSVSDVEIAKHQEQRRETLKEGKKTTEKLKELHKQMEDATDRGEDLKAYKEEKKKLENDLVKSKLALDKLNSNSDFTNTWKHATNDIRNMLRSVRDGGVDTQTLRGLEKQLQEMSETIAGQNDQITKLNDEVSQQRKKMKTDEDNITQLLSENAMLRDELERVRIDLFDSRKKVATIERQHFKQNQEANKIKEDIIKQLTQNNSVLTQKNRILHKELMNAKHLMESKSPHSKFGRRGGVKQQQRRTSLYTPSSSNKSSPLANSTLLSSHSEQEEGHGIKRQASEAHADHIDMEGTGILKRDAAIMKLQEQLEEEMVVSDQATGKLKKVVKENKMLMTRIAELERIVQSTGDEEAITKVQDTSTALKEKVAANTSAHRVPSRGRGTSSLKSSNKRTVQKRNKQPQSRNQTAGNQSENQSYRSGNWPPQSGNRSQLPTNPSPQSENQPQQSSNQTLQPAGNQHLKQPLQSGKQSRNQSKNQSRPPSRLFEKQSHQLINRNRSRHGLKNQPHQVCVMEEESEKNANQSQEYYDNQVEQGYNQFQLEGDIPQHNNGQFQLSQHSEDQFHDNLSQHNVEQVHDLSQHSIDLFQESDEEFQQTIIGQFNQQPNNLSQQSNELSQQFQYEYGDRQSSQDERFFTFVETYNQPLLTDEEDIIESSLEGEMDEFEEADQSINDMQSSSIVFRPESRLVHPDSTPPAPPTDQYSSLSNNQSMKGHTPSVVVPKGPSKEEAALGIVVDVLQKLNKGVVTSAAACNSRNSSSTMQNIQKEMDRIVQMIHAFMESSLLLVDKEVDSMNIAAKHLYANLSEKEKFEAERKAYKAVQYHDIERRNFKNKIKKFGEEAIKALKAGEDSVQSHMTNEQCKLSCVVSVMADHKKKQSKSFKFKLPHTPENLIFETQSAANSSKGASPTPSQPYGSSGDQRHAAGVANEESQQPLVVTQYPGVDERLRTIMMLAEGKLQHHYSGQSGSNGDKETDGGDVVHAGCVMEDPEFDIQGTNLDSKKTTTKQSHIDKNAKGNNTVSIPYATPTIFNPFQNAPFTTTTKRLNEKSFKVKPSISSRCVRSNKVRALGDWKSAAS